MLSTCTHSFILDRRPIDPPPIVQMRLNNATPQQTEYVRPMIYLNYLILTMFVL